MAVALALLFERALPCCVYAGAEHKAWARTPYFEGLSPEQLLEHARHRFSEGDYDTALLEFKRFVYFYPEHPLAAEIHFHIGESYFHTGRLEQALDYYRETARTYPESSWATRSRFRMSLTYLRMNDPDAAAQNLYRLSQNADSRKVRDKAFYRLAWISLERRSPGQARAWLSRISPEGKIGYKVTEILSDLDKIISLPEKSPVLAGIFSVIPGGGYLYVGRYRDAAIAFGVNAALMAAAWESWENDLEILGGVIALADLGFYTGSIYGGISSAHKYNQRWYDAFMDKLAAERRISLSLAPDPAASGWRLSLTCRF